MWLIKRSEVGRLAFARMVRDGVIAPLLPGIALPMDVADGPAIRQRILADCLPAGCQATGGAALWAHGIAATPTAIHVRSPAGRHVRNWEAPLPMVYHGVGLAPRSGAIAEPTTALRDALRWAEPLSAADAVAGSFTALQDRVEQASTAGA